MMIKAVRYIILLVVLALPGLSYAGWVEALLPKPDKLESHDPKPVVLTPKDQKEKQPDAAKGSGSKDIEVDALPEKKPLDASDFIGPRPKNYEEIVPPVIKENEDAEQLACKVTPTVGPDQQNQKPIKKSNNLMRKAGSPSRAAGSYIQITGMILDENCLPIQGAVVEIWQADSLGNYEWEYDTDSHFELPLAGKDNNFLFSGQAQTDNRGQFYLLTILPGSKGGVAPHINIVVKRKGYDTLHTRMYFSEHPLNDTDKLISTASESVRERLLAVGRSLDPTGKTEGRLYYFPITMRGINAYKRF